MRAVRGAGVVALGVACWLSLGACRGREAAPTSGRMVEQYVPSATQQQIVNMAETNTDYRRVVYTGQRSQVAVMSLPPGIDIGDERHERVEQIIVSVSGTGRARINGADSEIKPGDMLVVTAGINHDVTNTGSTPLKLYVVYTPPNHIDGRVQVTKAEAQADTADQEFGRKVAEATTCPR